MDVKFLPLYVAGNSEWTKDAECGKLGAPGMFPSVQDEEGIALAKAVCAQCPVIDECLAEAIERGEQHGVWGGMLADERAQVRRNRVRRGRMAEKRAALLSDMESLDAASERMSA